MRLSNYRDLHTGTKRQPRERPQGLDLSNNPENALDTEAPG